MASDPTKLDDLEMLSLLARGLTAYMQRVEAGEKDPFPYPNALICGFNQLLLTCALHDAPRAQRLNSIPEFGCDLGNPAFSRMGREAKRFGRCAESRRSPTRSVSATADRQHYAEDLALGKRSRLRTVQYQCAVLPPSVLNEHL